jgi:hypothetical protein
VPIQNCLNGGVHPTFLAWLGCPVNFILSYRLTSERMNQTISESCYNLDFDAVFSVFYLFRVFTWDCQQAERVLYRTNEDRL